MPRGKPGGELRKLGSGLAPVMYLFVVLIVLVFALVIVSTVERRWGLHTLFRKGDIDAGVVCLLAGALLFSIATIVLATDAPSVRSWAREHLWHSAGVYAVLAAAALYLVGEYSEQRDGLGYGVVAGAFLLGAYAAAMNAAILRYLAYRSSRPTDFRTTPAANPLSRHTD